MKIKIINVIAILSVSVYIALWCGISIGKTLTSVKSKNMHVSDNNYSESSDIGIADTYNYHKFTAVALVDENRIGVKGAPGTFPDNTFVEVSGTGLFSYSSTEEVEEGYLYIFFQNSEDAEEFGTRTVYARRCDSDVL